MNANYFLNPEWKYWNSIAVDSSRVWRTGDFNNVHCEAHIYNLMLSSIKNKIEIEKKYEKNK